MTHAPRNYQRTPTGQFLAGASHYEGRELSPTHKEKLRNAATLRANTQYRPISINGRVYPNVLQAAKAEGVSARALRTYALSDKDIFKHVFYTTPATDPSDVAPASGSAVSPSPAKAGHYPTCHGAQA